ncbi:hypothetical protein SUGI_0320300 [Cryptomeria japonica]|uniref:DNA repair protein XRCC4 n=1 Tax=Cryptomeria japonica TaxID=3369 RepID=UPI002408F159|nr:DNA repair protein XRCC4 [Cryptomeria japonica]GLJ18131.1 hypothetical protein SUGI_0320300 [Cryptomeria japonica]
MEILSADTCVRIETENKERIIYVKGSWSPSSFILKITDGLHAWICSGAEQIVADRASQWDQSASEYLADAQKHLTHQQPGSVYSFKSAGNGDMRLSWTLEKEGTKLEWRWKCEKAPNDQQVTSEILDFLLDANTRLSEEVVRKTRSFDRMKVEAEKCLAQSEKFKNEKIEFESAIYVKFVAVLNSKKAKLRELRQRCLHFEQATEKVQDDEQEFSDEETDKESDQSNDEGSSAVPTHDDSKNIADADFKKKPTRNVSEEIPPASTQVRDGENKNSENEKQNSMNETTDLDDLKKKPVKNAYKKGPTASKQVTDRENQNLENEKQNLKNETTDLDATQVLDEADVSKFFSQGEPLSSAAALLAVPEYTSAPKRRRRV